MKKILLFLVLFTVIPLQTLAGTYELGFNFGYNRSKYSATDYTFSRRWGISGAYHFSEMSSIEFSYENVTERTFIDSYQDTTFHDKVISASWVQALLPRDMRIQPFVRGGVAQLNRDVTGSYAGGFSPPSRIDSLSGVIGAGFRFFLSEQFVFKGQYTSYLEGARIKSFGDNVATTIGLSYYF